MDLKTIKLRLQTKASCTVVSTVEAMSTIYNTTTFLAWNIGLSKVFPQSKLPLPFIIYSRGE